MFDDAFNAAEKNNIRIKATLTANSGVWHAGVPSRLHTFCGFLSERHWKKAEEYIRKAVTRYAKHPALGQWILWNEPSGGHDRTAKTLSLWRKWLEQKYNSDIHRLNERWHAGFEDFRQIPFPEDVLNPLKNESDVWVSYAPWLEDASQMDKYPIEMGTGYGPKV